MRVASILRTLRIRAGLRQVDVAARAGVSSSLVSEVEHGRLGAISLRRLLAVAEALDCRLDITPRWRGGELDRTLSAEHAAMHETVARLLEHAGWVSVPEATFSIYGERGAIDVLAFHPPSASLLVVELKTSIVDVQELLSAVDRYRRLAPQLGRERGWAAATVSVWVVVREGRTNRRRLAAHAHVLRSAFPQDGRTAATWLPRPHGRLVALSFLPVSGSGGARTSVSGVQRVRPRRASVKSRHQPAKRHSGER